MGQWLLNNLDLIITAILGVVACVTSFISTRYKGTKSTQIAEGISSVIKELPRLITLAEKISTEGQEKKDFVLEQVNLICQSLGFTPTDTQIEEISATIDIIVELSKSINTYTNTTKATITKLGE